MRQPLRCPRTGLWLARYQDPDGQVRQAGRFERKRDAARAIFEATCDAEEAATGGRPAITVREFFERWPRRFPRHPRTTATNVERLERYVFPLLPRHGDFPLEQLKRSMLREVMAELLARGLSKGTVDGTFASLSAMLSDAVDDEVLDANPARAFRVKVNDPRLRPKLPPRDRRAVPPAEVGAFMACVSPRWRAVCWAPFLTGARPGELFAMRRADIDPAMGLVYLHETADRFGRIEPGTKTTHHIAEKERRGHWTLCPPSLVSMVDAVPEAQAGVLFGTIRGRVWQQRNFYRQAWKPAQEGSGTSFTLSDARHTFSSRLLAAGVPLVEVAAWMGHSLRAGGAPVNTTSRTYAHATGEHREAALAELEALRRDGDREPRFGGVTRCRARSCRPRAGARVSRPQGGGARQRRAPPQAAWGRHSRPGERRAASPGPLGPVRHRAQRGVRRGHLAKNRRCAGLLLATCAGSRPERARTTPRSRLDPRPGCARL